MIKKIGNIILCILLLSAAFAQESKTIALVIGISTYQENPSLDYAHRDAEAFAEFLQSPNGGQVPKENITLLLNEQATIAAISIRLDQLLAQTNKNDTVYIYFSGHGDVDLNLAHDPGFLLAYDTPKGHYLKNAIEIKSFNEYIVNTLSTKKEATVIVITDACHSGKLTQKSFNNATLAAEQLRNVRDKEIRLTSCGPGELSQEDERWGNGRGVFSYYLIKGLNGEARVNNNNMVTLKAIGDYLKESLAKDEILRQKNQPQNPMLNGKRDFSLSKPVQKIVDTVENNFNLSSPLKKSLSASFFEVLDYFSIDEFYNYDLLEQLQQEEIIDHCITKVSDTLKGLKINQNSLPFKQGKNYIDFDTLFPDQLRKILIENPFVAKQFRTKFAQVISDKIQLAINAYLKGDAAELEKRQYYNLDHNYTVFPKMLSVARKLLQQKEGNPTTLEKQLEFKHYYFSGVIERLQLPLKDTIKPFLQKAIALQLKALAIEEDADYILNELGVLYFNNNEIEKAKSYFIRAKELNPEWAVPVSNLSAIYHFTKQTDSGLLFAEKAIAMQPDFQGIYINQGLLYEQKNNLLAGEELYQKSIQLNSRHYLPFERLGYIYLKTANFQKADSFLFEAEERKKGYKYIPPGVVAGPFPKFSEEETNCDFIGKKVVPGPQDVLSNIVLGLEWLIINNYNGDYVKAEKYFRTAIQINPKDHIAYHYLGKALFKQKRWQEAEINFKKAQRFFLTDSAYDQYMRRMLYQQKNIHAVCILEKIKENYYRATGDDLYLGDTYIFWGHYQDAEQAFKNVIYAEPFLINGYYKLWTLLLAQGKYIDAEPVFWNYFYATKHIDSTRGKQYLAYFYNKVARKFSNNGKWLYKAGSFFYNELMQNLSGYRNEQEKHTRKIEDNEFAAYFNKNNSQTVSDKDLFNPKGNDTLPDLPSEHLSFYLTGKILKPEIELPATREYIIEGDMLTPYLNGFTFLEKATTLLQDNENELADIYYKMGQLTELQSRFLPAMNFFKKAIFFKPDNASHKMKFVDNAINCFFYRDALEQLDSLASQQQINIQHRLRRSDFLMLAGRLTESKTSLQLLEDFKDSLIAVNPLKLKLAFIQNAYKKAIDFAIMDLKKEPDNVNLYYLVASLYAKQNKPKEALDWLQKAIDKGFKLGFVVKYDTVWDSFKKNKQWVQIVKKMQPIVYMSSSMREQN